MCDFHSNIWHAVVVDDEDDAEDDDAAKERAVSSMRSLIKEFLQSEDLKEVIIGWCSAIPRGAKSLLVAPDQQSNHAHLYTYFQASTCVRELPTSSYNDQLAYETVMLTLEMKERDRELAGKLLKGLVNEKLLSKKQLQSGVEQVRRCRRGNSWS